MKSARGLILGSDLFLFFCFLSLFFSLHTVLPVHLSVCLSLYLSVSLSPPSPAFLPAEENHDNHLLCVVLGVVLQRHPLGGRWACRPPHPIPPRSFSPTIGAIPPPPLHSIPCSRLTLNTGSPLTFTARQTLGSWTSPDHGPPSPARR